MSRTAGDGTLSVPADLHGRPRESRVEAAEPDTRNQAAACDSSEPSHAAIYGDLFTSKSVAGVWRLFSVKRTLFRKCEVPRYRLMDGLIARPCPKPKSSGRKDRHMRLARRSRPRSSEPPVVPKQLVQAESPPRARRFSTIVDPLPPDRQACYEKPWQATAAVHGNLSIRRQPAVFVLGHLLFGDDALQQTKRVLGAATGGTWPTRRLRCARCLDSGLSTTIGDKAFIP